MTNKDIAQVVEIEKALFASPWDEDGFDFDEDYNEESDFDDVEEDSDEKSE